MTTVDQLIQKTFYALISACSIYAMGQAKNLAQSVEELNRNMAVMISEMADQKVLTRAFDERLRAVERSRR